MSRERALPNLRFVMRGDKKILQQQFAMPYHYRDCDGEEHLDYDYEWRDVPLETSPTCTVATPRV